MNTSLIILALIGVALIWRFGRPWLNAKIGGLVERHAKRKTAQRVLLKIKLAAERADDDEKRRLFQAETLIDQLVAAAKVGELDGYETGGGFFTLHLYGPSADKLFEVVSPAIALFEPPPGSVAVLRYGDEGAEEAVVELLAA